MSRLPSTPRAGLDQRLLQRLKQLDLPPDSTIAVGFSGGNDSLALALALTRCAGVARASPLLVHIDHQLRPSSGDDAERCAELASLLGLPIVVERLQSGIANRASGLGVEEQARRERYIALARMSVEHGALLLATGHHLDDQAETVLLHLFRGSGLHGATGMREVTRLPVPWWTDPEAADSEHGSVTIWRPFLTERRKTLQEYLARSATSGLIDESNADVAFRRNVIRHDIIPVIAREWPGMVDALGRFAASAAVDDDYLNRLAEPLVERALSESGGLRIAELLAAEPALASRVVISWLRLAGVENPTQERVASTLAFAGSCSEESRLEAGGGLCVVRFTNELRIGTIDELKRLALATIPGPVVEFGSMTPVSQCLEDELGCRVTSSSWTIRYALHPTAESPLASGVQSHTILVDQTLSVNEIMVRAVRPGDRWLVGDSEVRDSLRLAGVHPMARNAVICLALGTKVLFIPDISRPERWNDRERTTTAWLTIAWETNIQSI